MKKILLSSIFIVIGGLSVANAQDILFSFSINNSDPVNSIVSVYAEFDGSGNNNAVGYTLAFYYDANESTNSVSNFDFSPTTALGWATAGNNSYTNLPNSNPTVPIVFTNRIEVQVFDGALVGTDFSTTPTLLATFTFNKITGTPEVGGEIYIGATADTDQGIVYNDDTGVGYPIVITGAREGILPLNLISFTVNKSGDRNAHLSWITANEENTSHFTVQRSFDQKTWTDVGNAKAAGYSVDIRNYELNDFEVYNGRDSRLQVYYRLVMVDLDGRTKLSPIKSVVFGNTSLANHEFLVYPNPASNGVHVEWDVEEFNQPTALEFYDINGKLILTQQVGEKSTQEYVDFTKTTILPGLYLLRVMKGSEPIDYKQIVVGQR